MKPGSVVKSSRGIRILRKADRNNKPRYRLFRYLNKKAYRSLARAKKAIEATIALAPPDTRGLAPPLRGPESTEFPIRYRDTNIIRCLDDAAGAKRYRIQGLVEAYFDSVDTAIAEIDRRKREGIPRERGVFELPMNGNK